MLQLTCYAQASIGEA